MILRNGDLIDVIAPASSIAENEFLEIKNYLSKKGLEARFYNGSKLFIDKKRDDLFAINSAKDRFEQLHFALENKDSKAVWCARGGYGSLELLPFLGNINMPQSKVFIGFSDITSLSIHLSQKLNWKIIYGPMLTQLAFDKVSLESEKNIFDLLFYQEKILKYELNILKSTNRKISAKLVGGCLSVIAANFGTKNQLNWKGKILFLEDIDETGEKIDRYFEQILQISIQQNSYPQAILLGNFKQNLNEKNNEKNIDLAIDILVQKAKIYNLDTSIYQEKSGVLGHSINISPIIIGAEAEIDNSYLIQCQKKN